jgi:hypothetical protein
MPTNPLKNPIACECLVCYHNRNRPNTLDYFSNDYKNTINFCELFNEDMKWKVTNCECCKKTKWKPYNFRGYVHDNLVQKRLDNFL